MPRLKQWIPSKDVLTCLDCGIAFSFLVRKHHCRLCGRVFCSQCSGQQNTIPDVLVEEIPCSPDNTTWWGKSERSATKRLCESCYCRTISIHQVEPQMMGLMLLTESSYIDMVDWGKLRQVSIAWKSTVDQLMGLLRDARQRGIPNASSTTIEDRLVRMHETMLAAHPSWQLTVLKVSAEEPTIPCSWLGCRCTAHMPVPDALEIVLNHAKRTVLYHKAVESMHANVSALLPFVPMLCYATLRHAKFFEDFFLPLLPQRQFAHRVAFGAKAIGNEALFQTVLRNTMYRAELVQSVAFADLLLALGNEVTGEGRRRRFEAWRTGVDPAVAVLVPGQSRWKLEEIRLNEIRRIQSSTAPTLIPCVCRDTETGRLGLITLLIKNEPVLKDLCVINCLSHMKILTQRQHREEAFPIVTYHVQPLTLTSGMVVVVSNATTLFEIANKHRISIQNYLIEKNRDASTQALRMRFVRSAAVSCVLSHVVGVGDRHLDNLMVTDDGCLFNIDFGYIFGSEVLHRRVSENSMKITPEILDALGGENSVYFGRFKESTTYLYNLMRENVKSFYYIFVPLVLCKIMKRETLVSHMEECLVPNCTLREATIKIEDCIRSNTFNTKWDRILDTVHFVKKTWLDS